MIFSPDPIGDPWRVAGLEYAGIRNAVHVDVNQAELRARLTSPLTGFSKTVKATTKEDLAKQMDAAFGEAVASLFREVNIHSAVAFNDGNPHSSTALAATRAFDQFGTYFGQTREEREDPGEHRGWFSVDLKPDFASFQADGYSGESVALPLIFNFRVADFVGLTLDLTPNYLHIETADVYQGAFTFGVPMKIIKPSDTRRWYWLVTPSANVEGAGCDDYSIGALLAGGGVTSLLAYEFKHITLSMGNQITFHESSDIDLDDYRVRPDISQQILKNGLQLTVPLGRRWLVQASGTWTHFVEQAAVPDYATLGGHLAYRFLGKKGDEQVGGGYLFLGAFVDLGDHYTSPHIRAGTGWQF